eukprot:CAMPEP_0175306988 /NCGR_PEP_ID=MMETSP0093-20121207/64533_1 /TAXON_ID=311494 /ORGANISM="Alexandrium monilatum, Strain CCMP3105" /LENGTH=73 /DNA_ID=CAMNT_0016603443 /DNA_START=527 /DNA_END=745 /DNA_ORIENTATION=-
MTGDGDPLVGEDTDHVGVRAVWDNNAVRLIVMEDVLRTVKEVTVSLVTAMAVLLGPAAKMASPTRGAFCASPA